MLNPGTPFNITLLKLTPEQIRMLPKVTVLDSFEGGDLQQLHSNGLFSTTIFGRVGEERRDTTFACVPLYTEIFHPIIYERLKQLKAFYIEILNGKRYATWDEATKDFIPSTELEGKTGYHFFTQHWYELQIPTGESEKRMQKLELIEKFRDKALINAVLIMPAGLRDITVDANGRTLEHEINDHYRRLIGVANTIPRGTETHGDVLNASRLSLQNTFNLIYKTIEDILVAKRGFLQGKWGSRKIMDGTRNVITAMDTSAANLDDHTVPGPDDTVVGLWQLSRGALPVTIRALKESVLAETFGDQYGDVLLIDPKSKQLKYVKVSADTHDRWTTYDGLEKLILSQEMLELRARPIRIEGYYLAWVYKPKDRLVFKIFRDIDTLPEGCKLEDVYPITYHEFIYLSNYRKWNDLCMMSTRYPVTGEGSTYPSRVFVRTTVKSEARVELDEEWQPMNPSTHTALVYPVFTPEEYVDSSMVHPFRLAGLGGDYDGDTVSNNILYSKESIDEINRYFNTRNAHADPAGGLRTSAAIDTINLVMHNLTG